MISKLSNGVAGDTINQISEVKRGSSRKKGITEYDFSKLFNILLYLYFNLKIQVIFLISTQISAVLTDAYV